MKSVPLKSYMKKLLRLYLCTRKLKKEHSSPNERDDIVILSPQRTPDEDEQPPPDDIQQTNEELEPPVLMVLGEVGLYLPTQTLQYHKT